MLLVAAACGGGSQAATVATTAPATTAASAPAATAAKPTLHVVVTAQDHHPKLGHPWTYHVRVTGKGGKPVACNVNIQFYFGGMSVGEVGKHHLKHGVWNETIPATGKDAFPPAAVGPKLVLHVTATAKGYRPGTGGWKLQVVK